MQGLIPGPRDHDLSPSRLSHPGAPRLDFYPLPENFSGSPQPQTASSHAPEALKCLVVQPPLTWTVSLPATPQPSRSVTQPRYTPFTASHTLCPHSAPSPHVLASLPEMCSRTTQGLHCTRGQQSP